MKNFIIGILGNIAGKCTGIVLRLRCLKRLKKWPNFKHPDNLFDQMMALALANGDNPLWAEVADKVAVHDYVVARLGKEYTNEIYGVWKNPDDIDFDSLPDRFAIKTNNSCGTNIIVTDKTTLDIGATRKKLQKWLEFPYGQLTGQMHYAHIKPLIFAEELLENSDTHLSSSLIDYKFICFHGKAVCMYIYYNRPVNSHTPWCKLYDMEGRLMTEYMLEHDINHPPLPLPASFIKMKEAAEKLSEPFPLARIDFYEIKGQPVLGEISLTPGLELTKHSFLTDMQALYEKTSKKTTHI